MTKLTRHKNFEDLKSENLTKTVTVKEDNCHTEYASFIHLLRKVHQTKKKATPHHEKQPH